MEKFIIIIPFENNFINFSIIKRVLKFFIFIFDKIMIFQLQCATTFFFLPNFLDKISLNENELYYRL